MFPVYTEIEAVVFVSPYLQPAAVEDLEIYTAFGTVLPVTKDIRLIWSPVTTSYQGNPQPVDFYTVYRDTVPYFTPGPAKLLATTATTTYVDPNAAGNTAVNYFYCVTAWKSGLESASSREVGEFDRGLLNVVPPKGSVPRSREMKRR